MNSRQKNIAVFVLVISLTMSGCGRSSAFSPTSFASTPAPSMTPVSILTEIATPPPTSTPSVNKASETQKVEGVYTLNGIAPDGNTYSGKLTITLNPQNSGGSANQTIYDLAWDNGRTGAGILIKDAQATNFLATSFGGPTCAAVFYSTLDSMNGNTETLTLKGISLKPGTLELGSEIAISTQPYLEGDYSVVGYNAKGSQYSGTLSITKKSNSVWQLTWNMGQPYDGIGISLNKSLFTAVYGGQGCGVSVYKVNADGSLHATLAIWGINQAGEETAIKQ
jgi:hypothetical protein